MFLAVLKLNIDFTHSVDWSGNQQTSLTQLYVKNFLYKTENFVKLLFLNRFYV
jgi:hypothetical protein